MFRLWGLLLLFLPAFAPVFGQRGGNTGVSFTETLEVEGVMKNYIQTNRATSFLKGWRVQILSTTDRERLEQVRNSFRAQYPYLALSWVHNRPYYMLRAGAFTDKLEAMRLQQFLRPYYPSAYLIQDTEIEPAQLLGSIN
ncbi:MAG: SPOR domain-containing protein [Haliscomenobacter sp.]|nr:SPOR domain-containing protein [Haliscomenobacter sp.]MBK7477185.1 SPOR domain-containing protein [Haliscomenobacter sp.]MBK8878681.1 SPOR domain-containing protein [Haliscomenobacter sp.]